GPAPGEGPAVGHRLGPLVLVMRESEVEATAVEVEALPQQVEGHHDALRVPPRPAVTPRRGPVRLTRLGQLPQGEVERRPLLLVDLHPGTGPEGVEGLAGEKAVVGD